MDAWLYCIRFEEHRLVAAEVDARQAAESLDRGRPLLLGTATELNALARRHRLALVLIAPSARRPTDQVPGSRVRPAGAAPPLAAA